MIPTIKTLGDVAGFSKQQLNMLLAMRYDTLRSLHEDSANLRQEVRIIEEALHLQKEC